MGGNMRRGDEAEGEQEEESDQHNKPTSSVYRGHSRGKWTVLMGDFHVTLPSWAGVAGDDDVPWATGGGE